MSQTSSPAVQISLPEANARVAILAPADSVLQFEFDPSQILGQSLQGGNLVLSLANGAELVLVGYGRLLPFLDDGGSQVAETQRDDPVVDESRVHADVSGQSEQDADSERQDGNDHVALSPPEDGLREPIGSPQVADSQPVEAEEENELAEVEPDSTPNDGGLGFDSEFAAGGLPGALSVFGAEIPDLSGTAQGTGPLAATGFLGVINILAALEGSGNQANSFDTAPISDIEDPGEEPGEEPGGGDDGDPTPIIIRNTIIGTDGPDELFGTPVEDLIQGLAGDDTIHAGAGDDIIDGGADMDFINTGGGPDTVFGGDHNDIVVLDGLDDGRANQNEDFRTVDGGSGFDTLMLGGPGETTAIDFSEFTEVPITSIEHIDLRGVDGETAAEPTAVFLDVQDVLDLTASGDPVVTDTEDSLFNTLVISGDSLDLVNLNGDFAADPRGATHTIDGNVYDVYAPVDGTISVTVLIDQDIEQIF